MGATYSNKTVFPRQFECRYCGELVEVVERADHRTVYCSARCEKQYWRDASKNQLHRRLDRGHITFLSREHYENRKEQGF